MPYKRTNWTHQELTAALANPVNAEAGPHAHAKIHAVNGELASHPLFQKARVSAIIHDEKAKDSNAAFHTKNASGNWVHSRTQRNANPLPDVDVGRHSTLDVAYVAAAVMLAFNDVRMQTNLGQLDLGNDMRVHVNFGNLIGRGKLHTSARAGASVTTVDTDFNSLFIYCKPNPGNKDLPIFQTVVPSNVHKVARAGEVVVAI